MFEEAVEELKLSGADVVACDSDFMHDARIKAEVFRGGGGIICHKGLKGIPTRNDNPLSNGMPGIHDVGNFGELLFH